MADDVTQTVSNTRVKTLDGTVQTWMRAWDETEVPEARIGLLHNLPRAEYRRGEPLQPWSVAKLFIVANGYCHDSSTFGKHEEGAEVLKGRKKVANAAFSLLCSKVFPWDRNKSCVQHPWTGIFDDESLTPVIAEFFRLENHEERLVNFPIRDWEPNHQQTLAQDFAYEFCRHIWSPSRRYIGSMEREWGLNVWHRRTLEIICGLRMLPRFFKHGLGSYGLGEGEIAETITKLEQISFLATLRHGASGTERRVKSIEEAAYAGSHTAQALLVLQVRKAVGDELGRIADLKKTEEKARQERQALQKK